MIVNRFRYLNIDREDLIQSGLMGLNIACRRYDKELGKLSTYAVPFIIGEIKRAINKEKTSLKDLTEDDIVELSKNKNDIDIERLIIYSEIENLPKKESQIIKLRYFYNLSQKKVATLLKYSQSKISRIEKDALSHLREKIF